MSIHLHQPIDVPLGHHPPRDFTSQSPGTCHTAKALLASCHAALFAASIPPFLTRVRREVLADTRFLNVPLPGIGGGAMSNGNAQPHGEAGANGAGMVQFIRAFDWSRTSLGPQTSWRQSLRAIVNLVISHPFPTILLWGPELVQIYNDGWAHIAGAKHPAALGQPTHECWPELREYNESIYDRVLSRGEAVIVEDKLIPLARRGLGTLEDAYITVSYAPCRDDAGHISGIFVTVIETTEKILAEREREREREQRSLEVAQRASDQRYRELFASIEDGFCIAEMLFGSSRSPRDYRIIEANPAFAEATGLRNAIGRTVLEMVPDIAYRWVETYGQVALTGEPVRFENYVAAWDRWFDVYAFRFGRPEEHKVAIFFKNVTERKRSEAALHEAEQRFRHLADSAPAILWVTEPDGSCSYLSRGWYDYTGQSQTEAVGYGWLIATHPDDADRSREAFLDANKRRQPFTIEYRIRRTDGEYHWAIDAGRPRFNANGVFLGYVGSVVEVDEHIKAREALRAQRQAAADVGERLTLRSNPHKLVGSTGMPGSTRTYGLTSCSGSTGLSHANSAGALKTGLSHSCRKIARPDEPPSRNRCTRVTSRWSFASAAATLARCGGWTAEARCSSTRPSNRYE